MGYLGELNWLVWIVGGMISKMCNINYVFHSSCAFVHCLSWDCNTIQSAMLYQMLPVVKPINWGKVGTLSTQLYLSGGSTQNAPWHQIKNNQICWIYQRRNIAESVTIMGGTILVTGGAGYVGSHCVLELLNAGYKVALKKMIIQFINFNCITASQHICCWGNFDNNFDYN